MTDNVNITPGAGNTIATDDIGGVQYQRVKATWGADGTSNDTDTASGKALPVQLRDSDGTDVAVSGKLGSLIETAPVSDTASSGLNGRLQRIAQRISSLIALLPTALGANGGLKIEGVVSGTAVPVSGPVTQATAANFNATVVGTGTFAVQAAQSGTWTDRIVGNGGAVLDGVNTAATAPANGLLGLGVYNSIEPSPTTGQSVGLQQDSKGRLRGVVMDAAGNTRGANVNAANQLSVSLDGGTGSTITLGAGANTIGALSANQSVNVAQINGATPLMGAGNTGTGSPRVTVSTDQAAIATWGHGATGSAVPANAVYRGGIAKTALPTAATDGNLTGAMVDKFGRQVTLTATIRDLVGTQATTISASTTETTIVTAGAAGVFNDLVMLIISNTSTATNTRIDFRDATAGSILFSIQSNGGQPPVGFALPVPIPQTTAANNWTAQCATSTTDIRIYAVFAKNK